MGTRHRHLAFLLQAGRLPHVAQRGLFLSLGRPGAGAAGCEGARPPLPAADLRAVGDGRRAAVDEQLFSQYSAALRHLGIRAGGARHCHRIPHSLFRRALCPSTARARSDPGQQYRRRLYGSPPAARRLCHTPDTRLGPHAGRRPLWLRIRAIALYPAQYPGVQRVDLVERLFAIAGRCRKAPLAATAARAAPTARRDGALGARGADGAGKVAGGIARCQGIGRGSQPRQVRIPGQYVARNPHADERRSRHDRAAAPHLARAAAARLSKPGAAVGRSPARIAQRHFGLLQDRGRAVSAGRHRVRLARLSRRCRADPGDTRVRKGPGADLPHSARSTRPPGRRPEPPAPDRGQSGR